MQSQFMHAPMVSHTQPLQRSNAPCSRQTPSASSSSPARPVGQRRHRPAPSFPTFPDTRSREAVSCAALASDGDTAEPQSRQGEPSSSGNSFSFQSRREPEAEPQVEVVLVRVRLSVHYRVHSRQMLCIGGSQIPFGWSFLSIAKVPMVWTEGDLWTTEVGAPSTVVMFQYISSPPFACEA